MKKILIVLFFTSCIHFPNKNYYLGNKFLKVEKGNILFNLNEPGDTQSKIDFWGFGKYKIGRKRIFIKTEKFNQNIGQYSLNHIRIINPDSVELIFQNNFHNMDWLKISYFDSSMGYLHTYYSDSIGVVRIGKPIKGGILYGRISYSRTFFICTDTIKGFCSSISFHNSNLFFIQDQDVYLSYKLKKDTLFYTLLSYEFNLLGEKRKKIPARKIIHKNYLLVH
ncbi:MAG: hypothetical protein RJA07_1301 [Bacteroidota bacterium]|jgi:hypothetical protein